MSDALSQLLRVSGVRGRLISRAQLGEPYGLATDGMPSLIFHAPLSGHAWIDCDGTSQPLGPGDIAVVPSGAKHAVVDRAGRPPQNIGTFPRRKNTGSLPVLHNERPPDLDLLCGTFNLGEPANSWLIRPLPRVLVVRDSPGAAAWLASTVQLMEATIAEGGLGSDLLVDRWMEILVIHLLRGWSMNNRVEGWLAAVADQRLGPVLTAVQTSPEQPWTVQRMSGIAGMSRTRFCAHFRDLLSASPSSWVTDWRMAVARRALSQGDSVSTVAEKAGYRSEAAFSRAFKRSVGHAPATWRARRSA